MISSYAGLRPLLKSSSSQGKILSLNQTSREHSIWQANPRKTFVAGGKYTTYRKIAEETVNSCLSTFPLWEREQFQHSQSKQPLHEQCSLENLQKAKEKQKLWEKKYPQYDSKELANFINRHAMESEELLEKYAPYTAKSKNKSQSKSQSKNKSQSLWQIEACYAIEKGMCFHLKDFYRRYSGLSCLPDKGKSQAAEIALCFEKLLNWPPEQKEKELKELKEFNASQGYNNNT